MNKMSAVQDVGKLFDEKLRVAVEEFVDKEMDPALFESPGALSSVKQKKEEMKRDLFTFFRSEDLGKALSKNFSVVDGYLTQLFSAAEIIAFQNNKKQLVENIIKLLENGYQPADSIQSLQEICQMPTQMLAVFQAVAERCFVDKRYVEAIDLFRLLIMCNPWIFDFWLWLAHCQRELGQLDDAINSYGVSLVLKENQPQALLYCADCLLRLNEKAQAREALDLVENFLEEEGEKQLFQQLRARL